MPKFIIKHGCCYIPPVRSESSASTCEVFTNPDFDYRVSEALCTIGQSSPEFANQSKKQISWGYLDEVHPYNSRSPTESPQESQTQDSHNTGKKSQENLSLFTIFGNRTQHDVCDSENIHDRPVSDVSIYRPTTVTMPNQNLTPSDKFLDCFSMCLWKCSSWCQKID